MLLLVQAINLFLSWLFFSFVHLACSLIYFIFSTYRAIYNKVIYVYEDLHTCASLSPSSNISRDLRIMWDFSSTRTPSSSCFRHRSVPSRPSRMEWCSCFRASSPWITCLVLEIISSWDNFSPGSSSSFTHTMVDMSSRILQI